jgi:hypothetical protein
MSMGTVPPEPDDGGPSSGESPLSRAVMAFSSVLEDAYEQLSPREHQVFLEIVLIRFSREIGHFIDREERPE